MKVRNAIQRQLYRVQRIAMPMSLALLIINVSLNIVGLTQWRGIHPYAAMAVASATLALLVIVFANIYTVLMRMHIAERRATLEHDPVQVYAFQPFQSVMVLESTVPMMRSVAAANGDEQLMVAAENLAKWAASGYIPRDQYPEDLLHYYKGKGGRL